MGGGRVYCAKTAQLFSNGASLQIYECGRNDMPGSKGVRLDFVTSNLCCRVHFSAIERLRCQISPAGVLAC